ncbi:MAG: ABC transporter permease [Firmicutes bacterium]|nr:ABC transporter permease [Bacillota bacterium]
MLLEVENVQLSDTPVAKTATPRETSFTQFRQAFSSQLSSILALIGLSVILSFLSPHFLTSGNLLTVLLQSSINSILAVGETFIILTGGIDLSVGSVVAFSSAIMGELVVNYGLNPYLGILLGLVLGTLTGLLHGVIITKIGIPPFIVTLGAMSIWRGLALQLTGGTHTYGLPSVILWLGQGYIGPVPVPFVVALAVYVVSWFILDRTQLGLYTYAIGGNEQATRLSGINIHRYKVYLYAICGFLSGLAGVILAGRLNSTAGVVGVGFELDAIAAVVIGGTSLFGGEGIVWGSLLGAVLMGVIRNGLNLLNVSAYYQMVVIGAVIVAAVGVDALRRKKI